MNKESVDSFIGDMKSLINEKYNYLTSILHKIGWNMEDLNNHINKPVCMVSCPFNSEHRMPYESLENHITRCERKHGSYSFEPGLVSRSEYNRLIKPSQVVHHVDNQSLVTESLHRNISNSKNTTDDKNYKQLMQLLAAERDAKRRRIAHRRVHTNRKTYTEILGEVIANQMETLIENTDIDDNNVSENVTTATSSTTCGECKREEKEDGEYLDVGDNYYDGNPYKRWKTIEKEERRLMKIKNRLSLESGDRSSNSRYDDDRKRKYDRKCDEYTSRRADKRMKRYDYDYDSNDRRSMSSKERFRNDKNRSEDNYESFSRYRDRPSRDCYFLKESSLTDRSYGDRKKHDSDRSIEKSSKKKSKRKKHKHSRRRRSSSSSSVSSQKLSSRNSDG